MALNSPIIIILGIFVTIFVTYSFVSTIIAWHRLRSFAGPKLAGFSYLWIARATLSGRMWEIYRDVSRTYGSVARIGPNELITDDPEFLRRMSAARSTYIRSSWYELNRPDPYEHSMFSLRNTAAHDKLKAKTAAAYGGKENPMLEAEVDFVIAEMIGKIKSKYVGGAGRLVPLDFARMAQYFTLDSITKIAFGEEFGFLSNEKDMHGYLKTIEDLAPMMQLSSEIPALGNFVSSPWLLSLMGPTPKDKAGVGKLMGYVIPTDVRTGKRSAYKRKPCQGYCTETFWLRRNGAARHAGKLARLGGSSIHAQPLTGLLKCQGAFVRHGMTQRECETEALFQIIAGSDTTATAIRATMLYIMTTPRVYEKLQEEIDEAARLGHISTPITNAEAEKLPYLQVRIPSSSSQ
jgi:hypothetical protein